MNSGDNLIIIHRVSGVTRTVRVDSPAPYSLAGFWSEPQPDGSYTFYPADTFQPVS